MVVLDRLMALDLFAGVDAAQLRPLAEALAVEVHQPGEVVVAQGEAGSTFVILLDGCADVTRSGRSSYLLDRVGPGSILGELSMLTGRPRMATVTASTEVTVAVGDTAAFEMLLAIPTVHERLADVVALRLAEAARTVTAVLADGTEIGLRPLLPEDADAVAAVIGAQSPEWIRNRFFTASRPSRRVIDHLVHINYIDHFAWLAVTADHRDGIAIGRYIRLPDDRRAADLAFGVVPGHHGRGLGSLLLGALAAVAAAGGITDFTAEVLHDNRPMRAVFAKAGARWKPLEPGVGATRFPVAAAHHLIDDDLRGRLLETAREIVTGAGLALAAPPPTAPGASEP